MGFCPKCGKRTEKDFCADCRPLTIPEIKDVHIKICTLCHRFMFKNKWRPLKDLQLVISKHIHSKYRHLKFVVVPNMPDIQFNPGIRQEFSITCQSPHEIMTVPGTLEVTYCPNCSKKGSQYFEGILQLRNPTKKIKAFIREESKKAQSKGVHINKIEPVKGGLDYYFTDKRFLKNLGLKLKKTFEGEYKESAKLFTRDRQKSRDVYRVNILFRVKE